MNKITWCMRNQLWLAAVLRRSRRMRNWLLVATAFTFLGAIALGFIGGR
jgi:hypothetical protein